MDPSLPILLAQVDAMLQTLRRFRYSGLFLISQTQPRCISDALPPDDSRHAQAALKLLLIVAHRANI